jgi:hypothetical protein
VLRLLRSNELPKLVEVLEAFYAESGRPGAFSLEAFSALWVPLIDSGAGQIIVCEAKGRVVGAFGAVFSADPFNGELVAMEQFWYCLPEARGAVGLRLFKQFEAIATLKQAKRILMVHLSNLKAGPLQKLYERSGYKMIESNYEKVIS